MNALKTDKNTLSYDVVIAGGGFAGAYCGKYLGKRFGIDAPKQIALICDENVLAFQPMLAEVAGASLSPLDVVTPLREFCRRAHVVQGKIKSIHLAEKMVEIDAGEFTPNTLVKFEHLVIALGGIVDVSRVPGMAEHGYILKNAWDAVRLRVGLIERLEEANLCADLETRKRLLTFTIVGGGYSGVETSGQILDLLESIKKLYKNLLDVPTRVTLVHSRGFLLPEMGEGLGKFAETKLRERGLNIILNAKVNSISANATHLSNGTIIEGHMVISTVGNAANPIVIEMCKKYEIETAKGRIVTEPTMQLKGWPKVWAIGDCAAIPHEKDLAPATAQFAMHEGMQVADNIAAVHNDRPLKPFRHKSQGQLAAIGHRNAVADVMGFHFCGFLAWLAWRGIYVMKLPGLQRKFRVLIAWTLELFFPRDISVVRVEPTKLIENRYFDTGDCILQPGDEHVSFYIVKSGSVECTGEGRSPRLMAAGDYIGGDQNVTEGHWAIRAVAKEPCHLIRVQQEVMKILFTSKEISERLNTPASTGNGHATADSF